MNLNIIANGLLGATATAIFGGMTCLAAGAAISSPPLFTAGVAATLAGGGLFYTAIIGICAHCAVGSLRKRRSGRGAETV